MKKITLLALLALSFASCKKDRTCTCTNTLTEVITGGPDAGTYNQSSASTTTLKDVNGKSARSNCLSFTAVDPAYPDGQGGTVVDTYKKDCKLD